MSLYTESVADRGTDATERAAAIAAFQTAFSAFETMFIGFQTDDGTGRFGYRKFAFDSLTGQFRIDFQGSEILVVDLAGIVYKLNGAIPPALGGYNTALDDLVTAMSDIIAEFI